MKSNRGILTMIAWILAAACLLCCVAQAAPAHGEEHCCSGDRCLVCLFVRLREHLAAISYLLAALLLLACPAPTCASCNRPVLSRQRWTPVCLKVKLSN